MCSISPLVLAQSQNDDTDIIHSAGSGQGGGRLSHGGRRVDGTKPDTVTTTASVVNRCTAKAAQGSKLKKR